MNFRIGSAVNNLIRIQAVFAASVAVLVGCCTPAGPSARPNEAPPRRAVGETFVVTGRFFYEDGDKLSWRCARSLLCVETLIRDERFQREIGRLLGATLTLRVERVSACGSESSEVACMRSPDGTALRILEWIALDPPRR
jgi:hypothetical protein